MAGAERRDDTVPETVRPRERRWFRRGVEEDLLRLTYVSVATRPPSADQLTALLDVSRRLNKRSRVTGLLVLRNNSHFVQLLEGPADAVTATMDRIRADARHTDILVLLSEPATERWFAKWSMAYRQAHTSPVQVEWTSAETGLDKASQFAASESAYRVLVRFRDELHR